MAPVRLDLTARLCEALGLFDHADVELVKPAGRRRRVLATVHDADYIAAVQGGLGRPGSSPTHAGAWAPRTTPPSPACTRPAPGSSRARVDLCERCGRATEHGVNFCGGLHHAMPGHASGFCIYNDVGRRHPVAARPRRAAGRLRRHRRAPRRRRRADVLGRPPGAHDLAARERPDALPRHRVAGRHRRARRAGHGGQRRAAAGHRRRRLAARVPRRSSRRWCGRSRPRCWSASTAATPTCRTPWRTWPCPSTPSGTPTRRCTTWPTRCAAAGGSPSAAAATSSSTSCRARGRT